MTSPVPARARSQRSTTTRTLILDAAERLFAEHGITTVSNRTIADAAGQGNTAVVGYHFGSKQDLVRAIAARHSAALEDARARLVDTVASSRRVRDWVGCLIHPQAEHLARLGSPSWYARFAAQVATDPALHQVVTHEALSSPTLQRILDGLNSCLPSLPPETRLERSDIARVLLVHVFAERERTLAEGRPTARATWSEAADGLVDAVTAVWTAPLTHESPADA